MLAGEPGTASHLERVWHLPATCSPGNRAKGLLTGDPCRGRSVPGGPWCRYADASLQQRLDGSAHAGDVCGGRRQTVSIPGQVPVSRAVLLSSAGHAVRGAVPAAARMAGLRSHYADRNAGEILAALHSPVKEIVVLGMAHVPADIDDGSIRRATAYRPMGLTVISHLDVRQVRKRHGRRETPRILDRW
jgi:hypothetical protein